MDAQLAAEVYNNTLQAGFAGIALVLAGTGFIVAAAILIIFWRIFPIFKRRSDDNSVMVKAMMQSSQATVDIVTVIQKMNEGQDAIAEVLTKVDTNVEGLKEQSIKTGDDITATYKDVRSFWDDTSSKIRRIDDLLERHDTKALERHNNVVGEIDSVYKYLEDMNSKFTVKFNEVQEQLATMSARQNKIIEFVRKVDTSELLEAPTESKQDIA